MQHLFRLPQDQVSNEDGLLLARVGAEGIDKRSLSVAQAELDEVLTDQSGVGVHGVGLEVVGEGSLRRASENGVVSRGKWIHVFDAASVALFALLRDSGRLGLGHAENTVEASRLRL